MQENIQLANQKAVQKNIGSYNEPNDTRWNRFNKLF